MGNKVPYETCEFVPSVKCHLVLKKVAELECVPVVNEECNDFAKEIPYLVGEEECEEVVYDDCFEVSQQSLGGNFYRYIFLGIASPISFRLKNKCQSFFAKEHVLTTSQSFFRGARSSHYHKKKHLNCSVAILVQVFRKEGEKRRKKTGMRQ